MFRFLRSSHFVLLSLCLFSSTLFAAQKTDSQTPLKSIPETETVYVYASRLPVLKQEQSKSSSNTTVISEEELKAHKPQTLQEALTFQEGVIFYDAVGNGLDKTFSLRGFNESGAVTFLVDGVRMNELDGSFVRFPLISMSDLERIQIERGSVSPVYGSSALAGVVNITTGRPSKKPWSLFGGLDIGSHRTINFYQGLSGTVQDKLSHLGGAFEYYFKGGRNQGNGFRGNSDYGLTDFDIKSAYVLPEESGRFYINVKNNHSSVSTPGELTREQYDASTKWVNKPLDYQKFVDTIIQVGADKKFLDNKITASVMANWRQLRRSAFATFGTFNDCQPVGPLFLPCIDAVPNTDFVESKARNHDLNWQLAYDDQWDWLANHSLIGMEFRNGTDFSKQLNAPLTIINTATATTDRIAHISNQALFWNETLGLTKYTDIHFGMRHDRYSLQTDNKVSPTDSYSTRWNASVLNTGITLHPHESTDVFFNYAQGFRVPDISDINGFGSATFANAAQTQLRPEQSDSYEIGSRYHFRDLFKLRGIFFVIDMENEIIFNSAAISASNPFGQNINAAKTRRQGFETGVDIKPFPELSFFGTYTLMNAYIRETGGSSFVDGRAIGQIPQNRMTWGMETNPLVRLLGEPFGGLKFRLDGNFTGQQHPSGYESTSQATLNATGGAGHIIKSYTLWNFLASYKLKGYEAYFKVNNIFDNKYYSRAVTGTATGLGTPIYPAGTYTFVNPGATREYLLGLRWEIE